MSSIVVPQRGHHRERGRTRQQGEEGATKIKIKSYIAGLGNPRTPAPSTF